MVLAEEAERQIRDQVWVLATGERVLVRDTVAGLRKVVGPSGVQGALPQIERLERLREVLAVLAISLARTHGRLAWFLSGAISALEPVLRWRALAAGSGGSFGTVLAGGEEYAEGRRLSVSFRTVLSGWLRSKSGWSRVIVAVAVPCKAPVRVSRAHRPPGGRPPFSLLRRHILTQGPGLTAVCEVASWCVRGGAGGTLLGAQPVNMPRVSRK